MFVCEDEAQVWALDQDGLPPIGERGLDAVLSASERRRAAGFRLDCKRRQFVTARAMLRHLLSAYLDMPAASIPIVQNAYGKPSIAGGAGERIGFSLSHSCGRLLIAIASQRDIGIDLERIRAVYRDAFARRVLGAAQYRQIGRRDVMDRARDVCVAWCEREAYLKACGRGLASDFAAVQRLFEKQALPGTQPGRERRFGDWSVRELQIWPDYASAICTNRLITSIRVSHIRQYAQLPRYAGAAT